MKKRHIQKLVVLALGLFLLWNLPFLLIFNVDKAVWGIPVFYLSVFTIWGLAIFVSYRVLRKFYE